MFTPVEQEGNPLRVIWDTVPFSDNQRVEFGYFHVIFHKGWKTLKETRIKRDQAAFAEHMLAWRASTKNLGQWFHLDHDS